MKIEGQYILITGGASGLGAATAAHLANKGAQIILLDRDMQAANQLAEKLQGQAFAADVSKADEIERVFQLLRDKKIALRGCVNCAGILKPQRIVGKDGVMPLDVFNQVIQVNLVGTFNVMRMAAQLMSQLEPLGDSQERGVIINTASIAAFEGQIGQAAYSASKSGVIGLALPAAREFARFGVRVMTIAPGIVATPMMLSLPQNVQDHLASQVPFPSRLAKPEEYAMLVQHIMENSMLNGEVIRLDGAMRMV